MGGENGRDKSEWWNFQFEPGAWKKDPGVQSLTYHERGIWLELLLVMHESPRRGVLLFDSGAVMDDDAIASTLKIPLVEWMANRSKLVGRGIAGVDESSGALFNRKMLRDTENRSGTLEARREAGRKGAEKRWHPDSKAIEEAWQMMGKQNNKQNNIGPPLPLALDGQLTPEAPKRDAESTPEADSSKGDPLKSVNFRVGILLLLSVQISERVAKGIAGEHPVGRIAEVVIAAQGQKKPSGFAITALEKGYVVPPLEGDERAKLLEAIAKVPPGREIPKSRHRAPLAQQREGESDDAFFKRYNDEIRKRQKEAGDGPTKV